VISISLIDVGSSDKGVFYTESGNQDICKGTPFVSMRAFYRIKALRKTKSSTLGIKLHDPSCKCINSQFGFWMKGMSGLFSDHIPLFISLWITMTVYLSLLQVNNKLLYLQQATVSHSISLVLPLLATINVRWYSYLCMSFSLSHWIILRIEAILHFSL